MAKSRQFNWISAAVFGVMGFCFAANQTLVGNISAHLGADAAQMGYMISSLYGGSLAAVLFLGELAQRAGKRLTACATAAAVSLGLFFVLFADSAGLVIGGLFLYGAGIGGFESCLMSLVTDNNGEGANRFLNFLQALFSTGAVLAPVLLSAVFRADQYRPFYAVAAAWYSGLTVYFLLARGIDRFAVRGGVQESGLAFFALVKNRYILAYMLAMIVYLGSETALTFWIGSYFTGQGIGAYGAAALSIYWFASILGRLLGTRFRSPSVLIGPCFFGAAAGCVLLLVLPSPLAKIAAVALVGVAFAPLYAGLALLAGTLFPEQSSRAFSLMIFSAGVGGAGFQPLISRLLSSGAPARVYGLLAGLCAACGALMLAVHKARASGRGASR